MDFLSFQILLWSVLHSLAALIPSLPPEVSVFLQTFLDGIRAFLRQYGWPV